MSQTQKPKTWCHIPLYNIYHTVPGIDIDTEYKRYSLGDNYWRAIIPRRLSSVLQYSTSTHHVLNKSQVPQCCWTWKPKESEISTWRRHEVIKSIPSQISSPSILYLSSPPSRSCGYETVRVADHHARLKPPEKSVRSENIVFELCTLDSECGLRIAWRTSFSYALFELENN